MITLNLQGLNNLLLRASKEGLKGNLVVGYAPPTTASQGREGVMVTKPVEYRSASDPEPR